MIIRYDYTSCTEYKLNGMPHRPDGPAIIWWTHAGLRRSYWLYGVRHRYYGPSSGLQSSGEWFIHGNKQK
jgi:hypothetical protein